LHMAASCRQPGLSCGALLCCRHGPPPPSPPQSVPGGPAACGPPDPALLLESAWHGEPAAAAVLAGPPQTGRGAATGCAPPSGDADSHRTGGVPSRTPTMQDLQLADRQGSAKAGAASAVDSPCAASDASGSGVPDGAAGLAEGGAWEMLQPELSFAMPALDQELSSTPSAFGGLLAVAVLGDEGNSARRSASSGGGTGRSSPSAALLAAGSSGSGPSLPPPLLAAGDTGVAGSWRQPGEKLSEVAHSDELWASAAHSGGHATERLWGPSGPASCPAWTRN